MYCTTNLQAAKTADLESSHRKKFVIIHGEGCYLAFAVFFSQCVQNTDSLCCAQEPNVMLRVDYMSEINK